MDTTQLNKIYYASVFLDSGKIFLYIYELKKGEYNQPASDRMWVGCAFSVHSTVGFGFKGRLYIFALKGHLAHEYILSIQKQCLEDVGDTTKIKFD